MRASHLFLRNAVKARISVLATVTAMVGVLLILGYPPFLAAAAACLTTAGAVEVGCRLTTPFPSLKVRAFAVLVVVVLVITLICLGYPWALAVGGTLGTAVLATEIARRVTGQGYRLPRLDY